MMNETIIASLSASLDRYGDGLDEQFVGGETVTLVPSNGNVATFTVTLKYPDGSPSVGISVSCSAAPSTLTQAEWRNPRSLAARFGPSSGTKILTNISQGVVRLQARSLPSSPQNTDQDGRASFRIDSFHVCGNEGSPASDRLIFSWNGGSLSGVVRSAFEGLVALADNPGAGLTTAGLVGRHLQPQLIQALQAVGGAWQRVEGKPPGMPNYITVTGASMRWGGLNPPHLTHRFGGTADVRPIATDGGPTNVDAPNYHSDGTAILVDFLRQTGATEIRFAEALPGVTHPTPDHSDHIHASWLKQPQEPWLIVADMAPDFARIPKL